MSSAFTSWLTGAFDLTCQGNSASSCWSIPFFTVERKSEKREKFEGNIVRIFGVVFLGEVKIVLSNRQMDRASKDRTHVLMLNLVLVFLRLDRLFSFSGI